MADALFRFVPGVTMEKDDIEEEMQLWESVVLSRKKYKRTLQILDEIKKLELREAVKSNKIPSIYPGIEIFREESVGCLFSSESLSLAKFNVESQSGKLSGYDAVDVMSNLRCRVDVQSMNDPCLSWYLFFVMSIHEDVRVVEACLGVLMHASNSFRPRLRDIFAVLVNWGCDVDVLYPDSNSEKFESPEPLANSTLERDCSLNNHNIENILLYIGTWTSEINDIKLLIRMLLLSALEKRFSKLTDNFYECICCLVNRKIWPIEEVGPLLEMLHFEDLHFHNQAQAAVFMMGRSDFASRISGGLAYAALQQILEDGPIQYVERVKVEHLLTFDLDSVYKKTYYEIYLIVWLLKLSMKDMFSDKGFRMYLKKICVWLRNLQDNMKKKSVGSDEQTLNKFISSMIRSCDFASQNAAMFCRA